MPRQPLSQRSENAMDGQGGGGGEALMAKVKAAASDQGVQEMKEFLRLVKTPNDPKACQRALLLSKSILKREPDNALVKQFVPMLFQLCVFQDEAAANEESSSEEDDDEDSDDSDDSGDSDDDEADSDEDPEPEPEPEPVEPAATMAHSARERRIAALAAAETEMIAKKAEADQFGTRAHSLGISRIGGPDLPRPQTPAELAEADRRDAEMIRQVLMDAMVDDGQPVTKGEVERVGGAE